MDYGLIGKLEKAKRYAEDRKRFRFAILPHTFHARPVEIPCKTFLRQLVIRRMIFLIFFAHCFSSFHSNLVGRVGARSSAPYRDHQCLKHLL